MKRTAKKDAPDWPPRLPEELVRRIIEEARELENSKRSARKGKNGGEKR